MARPLVTANQVTFGRLFAIPVLCGLLYGGQEAKLIALFVGTAIGFTDFLDGYLARKYGPTVLGGLMDPIADKIFVAASLLCLADLDWVPWWLVHAVLVREMVVTALRSSFEARQRTLRSTYLAKVKTWVQMFAIAVVVALRIIPPAAMTIFFIAMSVAAAAAAVTALILRRRWPGIWIYAGFFVVGTTLHLVYGVDALLAMLFFAVIAVTWASAADYVVVAVRELAGGRDFHRSDTVRLVAGVLIPVLAALCLDRLPIPTWPIIALICAEIFHGGLDNLLAHHGATAPTWTWAARTLGASALLAAALVIPWPWPWPRSAGLLVLAALLVSAVGTAIAFWKNRRFYLEEKLREKPMDAPAS
jgi:CDP-diacylglycerol--glycerol-3-phosphate 3-phosphatidyltransferase